MNATKDNGGAEAVAVPYPMEGNMWQVECQTPAHAIQLAQALQFGRVGSVVGVSFFLPRSLYRCCFVHMLIQLLLSFVALINVGLLWVTFCLYMCLLRTLMQATVLYHLSLNTIDDDGPDELFCTFVYLTGGICGKVFVGVCRQ